MNQKCCLTIILWVALTATSWGASSLITYDWPTAEGEGVLSDKYLVTISNGNETKAVEVLMSESWDEAGGGPDVFRSRTFSWAAFSSSFSLPITVTVSKLFGEGATGVEVFPSGYEIESTLDETGQTVSFRLQQSRYVSVNFKTADNLHAQEDVIKHMLMIFADEEEEATMDPTAEDVLVFDATTTQAQLDLATKVYFAPGYYDLLAQLGNGIIEARSNQTYYVSGGAFISGKFHGTGLDNVKIHGRGVVSGRAWDWVPGLPIAALIELGGSRIVVDGIIAADNDMHGIVPGHDAVIKNVKLWGWHYNNDGFRPWGGRVEHCFVRPTDDAFYVGGQPLIVTDTVVWQSFNGAVVTCGWGSATNPYNTRDFKMIDSHIIYPEWQGIGNNNVILASQLPYSATSQDIEFRNVRVDGNVTAITNLKRNESQARTGTPGGISNVVFKNLWISGRQQTYNFDRTVIAPSRSLIRGDEGFRIENVRFEDVFVSGGWLTELNAAAHFDIDVNTTSGVEFIYTHEPVVAP
ncbi:MAG: hypothetical protein MI748_17690 [Opitutales bacterium]|nr:hypothetical protein [Opitutales bacterium]